MKFAILSLACFLAAAAVGSTLGWKGDIGMVIGGVVMLSGQIILTCEK